MIYNYFTYCHFLRHDAPEHLQLLSELPPPTEIHMAYSGKPELYVEWVLVYDRPPYKRTWALFISSTEVRYSHFIFTLRRTDRDGKLFRSAISLTPCELCSDVDLLTDALEEYVEEVCCHGD